MNLLNAQFNTLFLAVFCLFLLTAVPAQARPVSYAGGWTLMLHNDGDMNTAHIHYSPTARYSLGWRHDYLRKDDAQADMLQANILLYRKNNPASQANVYLFTSAGLAYDSDESEAAGLAALSADWENRRLFVMGETMGYSAGDFESFHKHTARIGIAPYVAEYGALHTWLMLQADYDAGKKEDEATLTPLARFFKGPVLVETGYNLQEKTLLFNAAIRF